MSNNRLQRRGEVDRAGVGLKVRKDRITEYKEKRETVWPEILDALGRHGWRNYSLFLADDSQLFGYVEAEESLEKSFEGLGKEEVNTKWQAEFAPFFETFAGRPDQSIVKLGHYFHLE